MKKKSAVLLILALGFGLYSQEFPLKVIESKGKVDFKYREEAWKQFNIGDLVLEGTEIFTGYHAQVTLEAGQGSYITLNQLTHAVVQTIRAKKNETNTDVFLKNGFMVVYSKKKDNVSHKVIVSFEPGNAVFSNSGGEVYMRKGRGVVIRSFLGTIAVNPKIKTFHFVFKDDLCAITEGGVLVDGDKLARRMVINKPNQLKNETELEAYYNLLLFNFTEDVQATDYNEYNRP